MFGHRQRREERNKVRAGADIDEIVRRVAVRGGLLEGLHRQLYDEIRKRL